MFDTIDSDIEIPSPELFPHLELDKEERRATGRQHSEHLGIDHDEMMERIRATPATGETPPEHYELDTCDFCGTNDDGPYGNHVKERPSSAMTAPDETEYLCAHCFAQVVAEEAEMDLYDALIMTIADAATEPWEIAINIDREESDVKERYDELKKLYELARAKEKRGTSMSATEAGVLKLFPLYFPMYNGTDSQTSY